MIGPHEEQELELMLKGTKPLAVFCDYIPDHKKISEKIIPEKKFNSCVKNGNIIRFHNEIITPDGILKHVCFTTPNEEWRAHSYFFFSKKIFLKQIPYTDTMDRIFGSLLGYNEEDITHFINQ